MRIILVGYGQMGQMIAEACKRAGDIEVVGVVHPGLFDSPLDVPDQVDAIVDFSYPGNLSAILEYALKTRCALLIGTTGYSTEQLAAIKNVSKTSAIMHSSNYSLGVAVLRRALAEVAPLLMDSFDVEIVETHHHKKADAPSGTAKTLLNILDPNEEYEHVYGRHGITGVRGKEIGIHAVRGGTVAGEHSISFFGEDEIFTLHHSATSRTIFVNGAVHALRFICGQPAGMYTIDDALTLKK